MCQRKYQSEADTSSGMLVDVLCAEDGKHSVTIQIHIGERTHVTANVRVADHIELISTEALETRIGNIFAAAWAIHFNTVNGASFVLMVELARQTASAIRQSLASPNGIGAGDLIFSILFRNLSPLNLPF